MLIQGNILGVRHFSGEGVIKNLVYERSYLNCSANPMGLWSAIGVVNVHHCCYQSMEIFFIDLLEIMRMVKYGLKEGLSYVRKDLNQSGKVWLIYDLVIYLQSIVRLIPLFLADHSGIFYLSNRTMKMRSQM